MSQYIDLWDDEIPYFDPTISNVENRNVCKLVPYCIEDEVKRGCVIVFPGGGYAMHAEHEGEPIAKWLNSIGYHAFVLQYRVSPYKHPAPMIDGLRAVRFVRKNAERFHIWDNKIGVLGFSAGGHLASCVATQYAHFADPIDNEVSARPDACVLCYPVVSLKTYTHVGSRQNLLGEDLSSLDVLSSEEQVTKDTPPMFIWHTADDEAVPVRNSEMMAESLANNQIPYELHIFPSGRHGLGLAENTPQVCDWSKFCEHWLKRYI